jgi:hypothetical protein
MNEAARIAEQIQKALPGVKSGTLRFWGVWFGRPHDNIHAVLECEAKDDVLRIRFNEDEVLSVWFPKELTLDASKFQIFDAERVRWEWFYYGRPKTEENRFFYDLIKTDKSVVASTNVNWGQPEMRPRRSLAAVEIH